VQTLLFKKYNIGLGIEHQYLFIKSDNLSEEDGIFEDSNFLSFYGYLNKDTFDNKYYPNKGWYFRGNSKLYLSSSSLADGFDNFTISKGDVGFAFSINKKWSFLIQSEAGFKVGETDLPYFDFILGGYGFRETNNLRPFFGYDFISVSGDSYIKVSLNVDYEIFKKNHVLGVFNASNIQDGMFRSAKNYLTKPSYTGYSLGYGYDSFLGPLEFRYSWSPEIHESFFWFNIGFVF
jgi:NTE family protein